MFMLIKISESDTSIYYYFTVSVNYCTRLFTVCMAEHIDRCLCNSHSGVIILFRTLNIQ